MENEVRRVLGKIKAHGYRLNPPVPEERVAEFEARHDIRLPDDYRAFLTMAGDGGAGPYYGISRLADWAEWFEDEATNPEFLSASCPMIYEQVILPTWADLLPSEWERWGFGSIHICTQGCTYSARLIVSGPSKGRVVYVDANGSDSRPYFVRDANFLAWYERWLDSSSAGARMTWFGVDNPDYPRESVSPSAVQTEKATKKRYVPAIYTRSLDDPAKRSWWQFWKSS